MVNSVPGESPGVDLSVTAHLSHYHYSGLHTQRGCYSKEPLCNEKIAYNENKEWWVVDEELSKLIPDVKNCPFGNHGVRGGGWKRVGGWVFGLEGFVFALFRSCWWA